ncbi:MAG TPA: uracil-DNA glycosylase [Burkholderiaceae bacterium]|nr:uracil-DNA glycosylase [Burkholderiaceae bacterium]
MPDNRLREPLAGSLDRVAPGWRGLVERWKHSPEGHALIERIEARRLAGATIYPSDPLRALALTPRSDVRVVILGQDPYHGPGQAEGLAFSVPPGVPAPPSLRNVLAELMRDLDGPSQGGGCLVPWARQGVLLLNSVLTVEDGKPASHAGLGWEALTDAVIEDLAEAERPLVFLFWGTQAAAKWDLFDASARERHCVLRSNHPSPLSARRGPTPFIGCGHFRAATAFMSRVDPNRAPIDWRL